MQKISFKARNIAKQGNCIFCYHFGRHLEYLKMLNDAKVASVRFLTGKVWATKISKEKKFEPHFQVNLGICWTIYAQFPMLGIPLKVCLFVCLFEALRPGQQFFSHFGKAS